MDFLTVQNRARFLEIWRKTSQSEPLDEEEALFGRIMREHPEFRPLFELGEPAFEIDFAGKKEVNPFLHTSLHAVVEQQISSRVPAEVERAFLSIRERGDERHEAIHRIGAILAEVLFEAVQKNRPLDEAAYLHRLKVLIESR
jgi:hypothetical protein